MVDYKPTFELAGDKVGITYVAVRNKVIWDHKSVAHDWLVTFAAWTCFRAYSPLILVGLSMGGQITRELLDADSELETVEAEFDSLCYIANGIRLASNLSLVPWPVEVPEPTDDRASLLSDEKRLCFDIAILTAAATFLHELAHVRFWAHGNAPTEAREEEKACDAFSREFLLSQVSAYANESGYEEILVRRKRVMGLATAAFIIDESSRNAGPNDTHPSTGDRFRHLALHYLQLPDNDDAWMYTASLMLASARRRGITPTDISFKSVRDLCDQLADSLD